jgi:hypothetical protein
VKTEDAGITVINTAFKCYLIVCLYYHIAESQHAIIIRVATTFEVDAGNLEDENASISTFCRHQFTSSLHQSSSRPATAAICSLRTLNDQNASNLGVAGIVVVISIFGCWRNVNSPSLVASVESED